MNNVPMIFPSQRRSLERPTIHWLNGRIATEISVVYTALSPEKINPNTANCAREEPDSG